MKLTPTKKCTWPTRALGLDGLTLGQWGFTLGPQGFSDNNILVSAMRKSHDWGIMQGSNARGFVLRWTIGYKLSPHSTGKGVPIGYPIRMKSRHKKLNVHVQCKKFAFGTQRNLYSTDLRWGFCIRCLVFASPNARDTDILVFFAVGNAKVPNTNGFASQWNIGFIL